MFNQEAKFIALTAALLALPCVPMQTFAEDEPVATTDGEQPGIRLEVTELARTSGDTLTLKFAIINESDDSLDRGPEFGDPPFQAIMVPLATPT